MKNMMLALMVLLMAWSVNGWAFHCMANYGKTIYDSVGTKGGNIYVDIKPVIQAGENIVVILSKFITCKNENPYKGNDFIGFAPGTTFMGELSERTGYLDAYYNKRYSLPLKEFTAGKSFDSDNDMPVVTNLIIESDSAAGGVVIRAGETFAHLAMYHFLNYSGGGVSEKDYFSWMLVAKNDVVMPTGGCTVSARNVTVSLPDYPASTPVPLTVRCEKKQQLSYYLSGTTEDAGDTIFRNTASASAAQGVGIQITGNGKVIPANSNVSLGNVGKSSVELGLTASYARTSGPLTAGNVQSIIGVTFVYQ
ncbi:fimbrial protein [Serratia fonticola]|uniref:fimbrial protein n=1 Tax=Serratia fonticola TaxID=47917 RepID=UPI003AABC0A6